MVIIWDISTGKPAQILKGHTERVSSVAWSQDGRLASGSYDNSIIIWDLSTGRPAQTLKKHWNWVTSVAWSVDGYLASGSDDYSIIIWDLFLSQPLHTLSKQTRWVKSVAWSTNGRLASGLGDGTVKLPRADIIRSKSCDWIYRNMTADEWLSYQGYFFIYQPACPNLSTPFIDMFNISYSFISWKGRVIILGIAIILIATTTGILRMLYKLFLRAWKH